MRVRVRIRAGAVLAHRARVYTQDVPPAEQVRQSHLKLHLQPAGAQQRLVEQLGPVGQPDDEHVTRLDDAVHLGEQLVDHRVAHPGRVAGQRTALARHGVHLVEDDDVQRGAIARGGVPG